METEKINLLVTHTKYSVHKTEINIRSTSTRKESAHTLDKYEFFYVVNGNVNHQLNDQVYTMSTGECLFCPPNYQHSFTAEEIVAQRNVSVDCELFDRLYSFSNISREAINNIFIQNNNIIKFSLSEIIHLENLTQQYFYQKTNITKDLNKTSCICLELLFCLLNKFLSKSIKDNRNPSIIEQIVSILETPEGIKGGISYLIEKLHYTESYIYHVFKKHMGISLIKFINTKKLQHIEYCLRATDYSLRTIADIVGIESLSYMNAIFRKEYNVSPALYRKIHTGSSSLISKNTF